MGDRWAALRGPRAREARRFDLLDATSGDLLGELPYVVRGAGAGNESIFNTIRSGQTVFVDHPSDVDWPNVLIRVTYRFEDVDGVVHEWPEGVYVPVVESFTRAGRERARVSLYDKTMLLADDGVAGTYTVPAGTLYETAIADVVAGAGLTVQVDDLGGKALAAPMVRPAGTTRLRIANDLLAGGNCFAIHANPDGTLRGRAYTSPAGRAPVWDFAYGPTSVTRRGGVTHEVESLSRVPNRVVLVGRSPDGETAGESAVAENTNPDSPYSYQQRGRWITVTERDVEAPAGGLTELAERRLVELSQAAATWTVAHPWLPHRMNDVVLVEGRRCVVQSKDARHAVGGGQITKVRELVVT